MNWNMFASADMTVLRVGSYSLSKASTARDQRTTDRQGKADLS